MRLKKRIDFRENSLVADAGSVVDEGVDMMGGRVDVNPPLTREMNIN